MIIINGHVEGQKLTLERRILATGMTVGNSQTNGLDSQKPQFFSRTRQMFIIN